MNILGVETSCDETALALVEAEGRLENPRFTVHENLVASQIDVHRPYGGVVPSLAKREHQKKLPILLKSLNPESRILNSTDLIAVTVGPGLEPALWQGITFAQMLGEKHEKEVVGVNHLHGHMYSFLLPSKEKTNVGTQDDTVFPAIQLLVSGGHTTLILMEDLTTWKKLGETRDDAVGEAFDKVARLLELPYPGGPEIERIAQKGKSDAIEFPLPMLDSGDYDFSFSGLKTAVLYYIRDTETPNKADIAASFQEAATRILTIKTMRVVREFSARTVIISGGVAANTALQHAIRQECNKRKLRFIAPDKQYLGDNAAMIAGAGYFTKLQDISYPLEADGNLDI